MFRRNGSTLGYWKNDMFYKRYTEVFYTRKTSFFRILLSSVSHLVISDSLWPHGCSLPGSSVHRILQERIQVWVAICFPKGSSWPRDRIQVCCIAGRFFTTEPLGKPQNESFIVTNWPSLSLLIILIKLNFVY